MHNLGGKRPRVAGVCLDCLVLRPSGAMATGSHRLPPGFFPERSEGKNVELSGAARLYRAASVLSAGLAHIAKW